MVPLHDRAHHARTPHDDSHVAIGVPHPPHDVRVPVPHEHDDGTDTLRGTVERLRDEVEGLQRSKDNRAVIEQAKGVLMERFTVDAPTAFAQLRRQARDSNRRLVDVAAEVLARRGAGAVMVAPPARVLGDPAPSDPNTADDGTPLAQPAQRGVPAAPTSVRHDPALVLLEAAASQAGSLDELAEVLRRHCRFPPGADRAVLLSLSADASVAVAASAGLPADVVGRWRHIPLSVDFPAAHTARTGEPLFEDDVEAALARWPVLSRDPDRVGTFCDVPVVVDGAVVAVVGLGWPAGTPLSGHDRLLLRAAVRLVTPHLVRLLPRDGVQALLPVAGPGDLGLRLALDAVDQECVLLLPHQPDVSGVGSDLVLAWGNAAARDAATGSGVAHRFGRTVSEAAPHLVGAPLWRACVAELDGRGPGREVTTDDWFWGPAQLRRTVVRSLYHGVLVVVRP